MDNRSIATMLDETADLLEISSGDPFRIRSYRRAAEAVEASTLQLSTIARDPADLKKLLAIPGIGKGMAANIQELERTGTFSLREELLLRYKPSMLELLKLPGMGPKSVALFWDALQVGSIEELEAALTDGRALTLPRFGQKGVDKLLQGIADYKQNSGRFPINVAEQSAEKLIAYLREFPGLTRIVPAGSLRRGRETVGDLDILVTGPACDAAVVSSAVEHTAAYPLAGTLLAKGANKVSFRMRNGLQVDVRLLPEGSFGAALQYFTGSKMHNVSVRQRALRLGYTLSEYALARVSDGPDNGSFVAGASEEDIYSALGMQWVPPELRENNGEIELAAAHTLPHLIEQADIRGDLHMHSTATDGKHSIREMAEAAAELGYAYIAITDHSKQLAMTNGLDDERALLHIATIHQVNHEMEGRIRVLTGIEVDILADGTLDLSDEVLAQMDIVIASTHSHFNQGEQELTERLLRAVENPYVRILGHLTGRLILRREPMRFDVTAVLRRAAALHCAVEHNASAERLDLSDTHLRLAHELGCPLVINTDAHQTSTLGRLEYGIRQLRRAGLTAQDVLNTRELPGFLAGLRPRPA
jgi:DNA polymerase (family 10)